MTTRETYAHDPTPEKYGTVGTMGGNKDGADAFTHPRGADIAATVATMAEEAVRGSEQGVDAKEYRGDNFSMVKDEAGHLVVQNTVSLTETEP